jgi:hypothetical protein
LEQAKEIFQPLAENYKTSAGKFALVLLELAKQEHALGNDMSAKQNLADARSRLKLLVKRFPNTIKFRELLQEAESVEFASSINK